MNLIAKSRTPREPEHLPGEDVYNDASEAIREYRRKGVVAHAGARLLAGLAEVTGLEQTFSGGSASSRVRSEN